MPLEASTIWWLAFGLLVLAELFSGSFYLLMLALGAAAGALVAHFGLGPEAQLWLAAGLGCVALFFCYRVRKHLRRAGGTHARPVDLDSGAQVMVEQWAADGTARVQYRGAQWTARYPQDPGAQARQTGMHRVREMAGNQLILEKP